MQADEIRSSYLKFFEEKGHKTMPSSTLVPYSDPTLLFTSAGMVQFKPYFLGQEIPPNPRLTTCQKCFRTTDIESVGDTKHLTFFEMLGNFSIGDYFKREAITWAWELVTKRWKLPEEQLWITVYTDDDESYNIWHREVGVPASKILRFGEKDNFWGPAGSSGPCGPCSEIHYDFGHDVGCCKPSCDPACKCGRFSEIWNLVFTQYNQDESGARTPLPKPNIDTGMGLERVAAILQGKSTVYETDLFKPLLDRVSKLAGKPYGNDEENDNAMRVVTEHSRAIAFLIADGVMPSNEGRGYVLRRLLRRTALFGKKLGLDKFMTDVAQAAISRMNKVYPELEQRIDLILKVTGTEEAKFAETLNTGLAMLDEILQDESVKVKGKIPGEYVFKLYDTYGFPVASTSEIARGAGFELDLDGFEKEMERQRERARASHKFEISKDIEKFEVQRAKKTVFVGYQQLKYKSAIVEILIDGKHLNTVFEKNEAAIILEATPFYGEMGGQVGDTGIIRSPAGEFTVTDTIRLANVVLHQGRMKSGALSIGDEVEAEVDRERRLDIARNHTSTHLLQHALRRVLGQHVQQKGSFVGPEQFRFDFSHLTALTAKEVLEVEHIVNAKIRENLIVNAEQMPYKRAVADGAIALFDEKYGDVVRVIKIGDPIISAELCGGTHVTSTGQIGFFQIVSESSIGSGLRRIEAVTGHGAEAYIEHNLSCLKKVSELLGTSPHGAHEKVAALLQEVEGQRKRGEAAEKELSKKTALSLITHAETVNSVKYLSAKVPPMRLESLRDMADVLKEQIKSGIVVLGTVYEDKPAFVAAVTPDLVEKGYHAGNIVREVAKVTGGGGGGKPGMAQAGGKDKSKVDEALALIKTLIDK